MPEYDTHSLEPTNSKSGRLLLVTVAGCLGFIGHVIALQSMLWRASNLDGSCDNVFSL